MERFVANENIRHFRNELEGGVADGARRATLLNLLLKEEVELGLTREQLDRLDRHIVRLRQIIAKQIELVERLDATGDGASRPRVLLATYNDIMAVYHAHRARIAAAIVQG